MTQIYVRFKHFCACSLVTHTYIIINAVLLYYAGMVP